MPKNCSEDVFFNALTTGEDRIQQSNFVKIFKAKLEISVSPHKHRATSKNRMTQPVK